MRITNLRTLTYSVEKDFYVTHLFFVNIINFFMFISLFLGATYASLQKYDNIT